MRRNRATHAPTLNVRQRDDLSNSSSITSLLSTAKAKICLEVFASALDSGLATVKMSDGQLSCSFNFVGPCHHNELSSFTSPPLLVKCEGFSWLSICLRVIPVFSLILWKRLLTNCLYYPEPLIQCRATVLSSHAYKDLTGNQISTSRTLVSKLAAV